MAEKSHNVNESADKLQLETKVKRGTGTRDQDTIKVKAKGNNPEEVVRKLNDTLRLLSSSTTHIARDMQADTDED